MGIKKLKVNPIELKYFLFNMRKLYGSSIIDCTTQAWIRALSGQSMDCTTILLSKSACGSIVHESTANKHYSMHTLYVVRKPCCCTAQSTDPHFARTIHGLYNSCAIQGLPNSHVHRQLTGAEVCLVRAGVVERKNISPTFLLKKSAWERP